MNKVLLAYVLSAGVLSAGAAAAVPALADAVPPAVAAALDSAGRPASDTARDAARHPGQLIAFAGLKPGDTVADFVPGTGYYTRIFSALVGPAGHVAAIIPAELAAKLPKAAPTIEAIAHAPGYGNVTTVVESAAETARGLKLDAVWTSDNYHDIYGFFGAKTAAAADASIFAALKPGGVFVVIDHVGLPGSSDTAPTTLHRIDPETVKAQVQAAGFVLEAQSDLLHNPADTHLDKVFIPAIKGHTDQFVFRFRKPAG